MIESLLRVMPSSTIYVLCFDDYTYKILSDINDKNIIPISLQKFESDELLAVKQNRTFQEYCWTCSSALIEYCLDYYNLDKCIYVDADLYFFGSPEVLIDELGQKDVLITEHRYSNEYNQTEVSGKYCVQFMIFKNNTNSRKVLTWWKNACLDWCYATPEPGKFGDQKYLDDWLTRFDGIHELQHLGGGVAPWNVQQYTFIDKNNKVIGCFPGNKKSFELIFYHFHNLDIYKNNIVNLGGYNYKKDHIKIIYKKYLKELIDNENKYILDLLNEASKEAISIKKIRRYTEKNYNYFNLRELGIDSY